MREDKFKEHQEGKPPFFIEGATKGNKDTDNFLSRYDRLKHPY
jgi:hypothetical protein